MGMGILEREKRKKEEEKGPNSAKPPLCHVLVCVNTKCAAHAAPLFLVGGPLKKVPIAVHLNVSQGLGRLLRHLS